MNEKVKKKAKSLVNHLYVSTSGVKSLCASAATVQGITRKASRVQDFVQDRDYTKFTVYKCRNLYTLYARINNLWAHSV